MLFDHENIKKAKFLSAMQQRIDRYKPTLEKEFAISLGAVAARPIRVVAWLNSMFEKSMRTYHEQHLAKHGRPPTSIRRFLLALERNLIWCPAFVFLYIRLWYPDFMMKWDDDTPAVMVSFIGWSDIDYQDKIPRLDQWIVHEMAHGVWSQIARDHRGDRNRRWWLWNEGFAHYVADVHMRDRYPAEATIDVAWSKSRQAGKQMVADIVRRHGRDVLKTIPAQWPEYDAMVLQRPVG